MYNLPYFKENNMDAVLEFITQHPFAFLCGVDYNNKPVATQLPVFSEAKNDKIFLYGHLMKATDHHKAFQLNKNLLCVFSGPHSYVSATWYSNPNQASTWNYMSVHVQGTIHFLDSDALVEILRKTCLYFENNNESSPTIFDNLPTKYVENLMSEIVGFEIEVIGIDNVFKLSQNKDKESYTSIIKHLRDSRESIAVAKEMEKRLGDVFK